jgi:hypothetical protein
MSGSNAVGDSCLLGCDTMYLGIWHILLPSSGLQKQCKIFVKDVVVLGKDE